MKIVAIGGADKGTISNVPVMEPMDNIPIHKKIIELSGKANPRMLFVGTAMRDDPIFIDFWMEHFSREFGANVSKLELVKNPPTVAQMRKILDNTDIVFVGGGNAIYLLQRWREVGFDKLLREYGERGVVLSGISAGGMCWFDYGNRYYLDDETNEPVWDNSEFLYGLGFIKGFFTGHYDSTPDTPKKGFNALLVKHGVMGYGVDSNAAVIFEDGKVSTISSQPNKCVHYLNAPNVNTRER